MNFCHLWMGEKPAKHQWNPTHYKQPEDEPVFMLITGPALAWNYVLHLSHKTTIICEKVWMSFPAFAFGNRQIRQLFRATNVCWQTSDSFHYHTQAKAQSQQSSFSASRPLSKRIFSMHNFCSRIYFRNVSIICTSKVTKREDRIRGVTSL